MATGVSIHVGVNATTAPGINTPALVGCENDAQKMFELARARGFVGVGDGPDEPIIKDNATLENVTAKMVIAAEQLDAGDIFLFTFSGHGTRHGEEDPAEIDLKDETLVLHDKLLIDNVLRRIVWPKFKPGVRVVMVSDSCHSGGALMSLTDLSGSDSSDVEFAAAMSLAGGRENWSPRTDRRTTNVTQRPQNAFRFRVVSESQAQEHFNLLKAFYEELRGTLPEEAPLVPANVLLLAACQEHETTKDGLPNGVFTQALLDVWNTNGSKTYKQLTDAITQKLEEQNAGSHPAMMSIGETPAFSDTEAFKV
jgi:hypothetical protein